MVPSAKFRLGRGASCGGDVALGQRAVSGRSGPVDGSSNPSIGPTGVRVLARLIGILGDFDLAEESAPGCVGGGHGQLAHDRDTDNPADGW